MKLVRQFCPLLFATLLMVSSLVSAADWPQWRGPEGQGHSSATNLPLTWSESQGVVWRTAIPGRGWSSPVIEGSQIWMTTAIESEASEEEKKKRRAANTGDQPLNISGRLSLRAVCVERNSGKLLHDIELLSEELPDQW